MSAEVIWRPIEGAPDYEVSNQGVVRSWKAYNSTPAPRILRPRINGDGYATVGLYTPSGRIVRHVHALVASAFLGHRPAGLLVRHLDGDPANNVAANLRYGTYSENALDAVAHGTHPEARKTHCDSGHAFDDGNTYQWRGERKCRACRRIVKPPFECPICGEVFARSHRSRHMRRWHDGAPELLLGEAS